MIYSVGNKEDNWLKVHFLYFSQFGLISLVIFLTYSFIYLTQENIVLPFAKSILLFVIVYYLPRIYYFRLWSLLYCCSFDSENKIIEFRYYFLGFNETMSVPMSSVYFIEICRKSPYSDTIAKVQKIYINNKVVFIVPQDSSSLYNKKYDVLRHLLQKFCTKKEEPYW